MCHCSQRVGSILAYAKWYGRTHYFTQALPFKAQDIEEYMSHLKDIESPASTPSSFLEAVNFCIHVLGMPAPEGVNTVISCRSRALADRALANRDEVKQARPLTVLEVKQLESYLQDTSNSAVDRYAAGAFLFALFARCRWSDTKKIYAYQLDVLDQAQTVLGYIEFRTRSHKTARLVARRGLAKPLVAPIWGVGERPWALDFVEAAKETHMDFHEQFFGPLLPAPNKDHTFSSRSTGSKEASCWLNAILETQDPEQLVSSHSLKATTLSWCSKYGMDKTVRQVLGHHSTGSKSVDTYSRDRAFDTMLKNIRTNAFAPDATRSGHLQEPTAADAATEFRRSTDLAEVEEPAEETSSHDNSSSDSASSSENEDDLENQDTLDETSLTPHAPADPDFLFFQHRRSRVAHKKTVGSTKPLFVCGLKESDAFLEVAETALTKVRLCLRCRTCKPVRDLGAFASFLKKQRTS